MIRRKNPIPPVVWLSAAAASQKLVKPAEVGRIGKLVGWGITLGSAALGVWAVRDFRSHQTTVNPLTPDTATSLVTDGAHSISRHPMYVAMVGGLLGQAVLRGRVHAVLPVVALWAALSLQATEEENALTEKFGRSYLRYRERVPRWL